jgi:catechol-2,3-dioxygenase
MTPSLEAVDHIHIFVADRAASELWYRNVLGFERVKELEFWSAGGGPLTLSNSQGSIHLALFERESKPCRSTVAFRTSAAEFQRWRAHLGACAAGSVAEADHEVSMSLYVADPDGNPYEITTYEVQALGRAGAA